MTKDSEIVYIDKDTYYQIIGMEDENSYNEFLKNNPRFKDINSVNKRKSVYSEDIVLNHETKKTNDKLSLQHKKDEDYRYFPHRIWLEENLPRFELLYGKFYYTSCDLTNEEKIKELLTYYSEVCNIKQIEEIKKSPNILKAIYGFMPETIKRGKIR